MYKSVKIGHEDFNISSEYSIKMMDQHKKEKRYRNAFTTGQINHLEKLFRKYPYISIVHRKEVAATLNLPEKVIKVWFQNRRMKYKKEDTNKELIDESKTSNLARLFKQPTHNRRKSTYSDKKLNLMCTDIDRTNCDENITKCSGNIGVSFKKFSKTIKNHAENNSIGQTKLELNCTTTNCLESPKLSTERSWKQKGEVTISLANLEIPVSVVDHRHSKPCAKPMTMTGSEQKIPKDLSMNRKITGDRSVTNETPVLHGTSMDSRYVFVSPQVHPYYPAGVLWNPLNVVPAVQPISKASIPAPSPIPNPGQIPAIKGTLKEKNCNCDCRVKPVTTNLQQQLYSPQYIITAIQLPNNNDSNY